MLALVSAYTIPPFALVESLRWRALGGCSSHRRLSPSIAVALSSLIETIAYIASSVVEVASQWRTSLQAVVAATCRAFTTKTRLWPA
jgi:hypothetical protein